MGLSNGILLAKSEDVMCLDVDRVKVDLLNAKKLPNAESELQDHLRLTALRLQATTDKQTAYLNADYVIIATPTDYDEKTNYFDTSSVDGAILDALRLNENATIVIKSTVPVGYTEAIKKKLGTQNILFSPEFLREDKALQDNFYPSRIVVGERSARG